DYHSRVDHDDDNDRLHHPGAGRVDNRGHDRRHLPRIQGGSTRSDHGFEQGVMKFQLPKGILRETLKMALDSVRGHKFRSFLTVLGIVIGVMTAICIASLLTGLRQNIIAMIEEYGTNNIYAFHLSTGPRTGEDRSERLRKPFTLADAETIKAQAPAVEDVAHVAPNVGYGGGGFDDNVTYQGRNYRWGNTQGDSPNYADITNIVVREGRF